MSQLQSGEATLQNRSSNPTSSTDTTSSSTDTATSASAESLTADESPQDSYSTYSSPSTSCSDSYRPSSEAPKEISDTSSSSPTSSESEHLRNYGQGDLPAHSQSEEEKGNDESELDVDKEFFSSEEFETDGEGDGDESEENSESVLEPCHRSPRSYLKSEQKRTHSILSQTLSSGSQEVHPQNPQRVNQERRIVPWSSGSSGHKITVNRSAVALRWIDNFLHKMLVIVARYHKELCIVFLVLACGFASIKSSPPKLRVTSAPNPFFGDKDDSYFLQDNYMGEYVDLANKQIPYYPSFIFYYAPWDSESVASKSVFLNVAKHFFFSNHGRVKFVAINCWWPNGQCRKNYKNLSHYPIFVAHIGKTTGIIYNGPIRLEPMVKFISTLLKPLTRIDSEEDLWKFRSRHDVIMLGYFNFTHKDSSDAYEMYLQMALRTLEADPFNQVGFGVFLRPELAEKFFLTSSNTISLVLFNEIHTAKYHGGYHNQGAKGPASQVADWIIERTKTVPVTWVYALRNGFANRPVALGPHGFAQQLSTGPVLLLVTRKYFPSGHSPFYMQVKEVALDYFNCNKSGNVTKLRRTTHKVNAEWSSIWSSVIQFCQQNWSLHCQQLKTNIKHWEKKRSQFKREPLLHYENVSAAINFTGLSCDSERSFKFLAIDPLDVPYFINLGLTGLADVDGKIDKNIADPVAYIIDSQNDIVVPISSFNITELALAIHNYTAASESGSTEALQSRLFGDYSGSQRKNAMMRRPDNVLQNWGSIDLIKYARGDSDLNNSILLLYTASFCGYCAVAVTHFTSLARFLADNYGEGRINVTLAQIDMFKNTLPLHLSPKNLPTVVYLPSTNRSDIKMYPENQEITSIGLLRFILSELDPARRVEASLMSPTCGSSGGGTCLARQQPGEVECGSTSSSEWVKTNTTTGERFSCIKSGRTSVSNQIDFLLQKLRNGDQVEFDPSLGPLNKVTPPTWNGRLLDRLRTMALTLDVS